jgi:hypothetical protein
VQASADGPNEGRNVSGVPLSRLIATRSLFSTMGSTTDTEMERSVTVQSVPTR